MAWIMLRMIPRNVLTNTNIYSGQIVPLWRGYNAQIATESDIITKSSCKPVTNHIPSTPNTLYTIMTSTKQLTNALEQEVSVNTVDQQLFAPSQEICWSSP